ncbi:glycerophosphoryl diester phosphodiesterase [Chitinophaga parva]|uniref:glycerophosphoryl diester phosphodiesterase n=1 Tax=Chitinophaga parva TaxID=2169414 RepID=UPI00196AFA09|nr:glycerophosphoryl diester phosphodiesterase [Chitinophaga parva]
MTKLNSFTFYLLLAATPLCAQQQVRLHNAALDLQWQQQADGYHLVKGSLDKTHALQQLSGAYTVLYSAGAPDTASGYDHQPRNFPGAQYKYLTGIWRDNLRPVPMNTAGTALRFFPGNATQQNDSTILFSAEKPGAAVQARWQLDGHDILVDMTLTAKQAGYYALSTPTLMTTPEAALDWGMVPGIFMGHALQRDLILAYAYGQGIPDKPVIARERTASTLSPLIRNKAGITLSVIAAPGTARDPWQKDHYTQNDWKLGLSLMDRSGALTPTLYHPVLGQDSSYMAPGEQRSFHFRYTLQTGDWYPVYQHAINDVYHFPDFLALKQTRHSLTARMLAMRHYLDDDSTSMWRNEFYKGQWIGAQSYLGGVVGSDKDAMKNADYGAMWMLAQMTGDTLLQNQRLPNALHFKLAQQQQEPGFFQGAATGQYYLWKSKKFTEEWGPYVEPIGLTYYTMLDVGNILLFEPGNTPLKERLRLGADKLLSWQHADGHWEVAYDHASEQPDFTDLRDLRPTFYGLLVAYRVLKDKKYLDAARKGADWIVANAVNKANFLGVCGDARFVPDFATGQTAQSLLDLYDLTKDAKYKAAAITTARLYTASVYTHPIPSTEAKIVNGQPRQDWEISQAGLSFEHGGTIGSANGAGPILLASHAGMFVRMFGITHDSLFLNMARAAAWGRDAFVDQQTQVASYYWRAMNAGAGPYPHHAWWQIGWITDYLLSEMALRSEGGISFPSGFVTPKVGPHLSHGFAPGHIFGTAVSLHLDDDFVRIDQPQVDYLGAWDASHKNLYLVLLNDAVTTTLATVTPGIKATGAQLLDEKGHPLQTLDAQGPWRLSLPAAGLRVIVIHVNQ